MNAACQACAANAASRGQRGRAARRVNRAWCRRLIRPLSEGRRGTAGGEESGADPGRPVCRPAFRCQTILIHHTVRFVQYKGRLAYQAFFYSFLNLPNKSIFVDLKEKSSSCLQLHLRQQRYCGVVEWQKVPDPLRLLIIIV